MARPGSPAGWRSKFSRSAPVGETRASIVLLGVLGLCAYVWAGMATNRLRAQTIATHSVDFPIPFPVDPTDPAATEQTGDALKQLAQQRAVERGKHLVA